MYNSKTIACDCGIPIYRQKGDITENYDLV